jgi:hypothetical protein
MKTTLDDFDNVFDLVFWSYFYFDFGIFKPVHIRGKLLLGKSVISYTKMVYYYF